MIATVPPESVRQAHGISSNLFSDSSALESSPHTYRPAAHPRDGGVAQRRASRAKHQLPIVHRDSTLRMSRARSSKIYSRYKAVGALLVALGHRGDYHESARRLLAEWRDCDLSELVAELLELPKDKFATNTKRAFELVLMAKRRNLTVEFLYDRALRTATCGITFNSSVISRMYRTLGYEPSGI